MDFIKKYYNAIVGVAIVGIFVLGLTISGSAGNILASISDAVGGQKAQVGSLVSCVLTKDLKFLDQDSEVLILQKFLNRMSYTVNGDSIITPQGNEKDVFDAGVKNSLYFYQKDAGIAINIPPSGVPDPIVDTATRAHINARLTDTDCQINDTTNSPYYFESAINFPTVSHVGEIPVFQPGQNIGVPVVTALDRGDGSNVDSSRGYKATGYIHKKVSGLRSSSLSAYTTPIISGINSGSKWTFFNVVAPTEPGEYLFRVLLSCAKSKSICDKDYGTNTHSILVTVPFKVAGEVENNPTVELISTSTSVDPGDTQVDAGTFVIKYKVTATGKDIRLPINYCNNATTSLKGVIFEVDKNGVIQSGDGVSCNLSSSKSPVSGEVVLPKGSSADFTLTVYLIPTTSGSFAVKMKGFNWGETMGSYPNLYSVPSTFKTDYIALEGPTISSIKLISPHSGVFGTAGAPPIPIKWTVGEPGIFKVSLIYAGPYDSSIVRYKIGEIINIRVFTPSGDKTGLYNFYVPSNVFDGKWYVEIMEYNTGQNIRSTSTINISSKG